jgi:hypothetical protein|tara:strand:- start:288 stop:1229 length:942 start_codon:yes stop_codon:yes gene_type:complete
LKIAFVGDSYCMHAGPGTPEGEDKELAFKIAKKYNITFSGPPVDPEYDWPHLVTQHFQAHRFCGGIAGINFFHSYEYYLNNSQKDEDIVIFCVTEPLRVINKHKLPINKAWLDEIYRQTNMGKFMLEYTAKCANLVDKTSTKTFTNEELLQIVGFTKHYRENIMDSCASVVMQHAFLKLVDEQMLRKGQKCIWFNSFFESNQSWPGWIGPFSPLSGPIGNRSLFSITESIQDKATFTGPRYDVNERNHFTQEQNIQMSKMVIDIIETDNFVPGPINMENWFHLKEKEPTQDIFYDDIKKSHDLLSKEDDFIYP